MDYWIVFRPTALSHLVVLLYFVSMNLVAESHETNVQALLNRVYYHYFIQILQEGPLSLMEQPPEQ